jgi:hypothetical protein
MYSCEPPLCVFFIAKDPHVVAVLAKPLDAEALQLGRLLTVALEFYKGWPPLVHQEHPVRPASGTLQV